MSPKKMNVLNLRLLRKNSRCIHNPGSLALISLGVIVLIICQSVETFGASGREGFSDELNAMMDTYLAKGGNPKALHQFGCFLDRNARRTFLPKPTEPQMQARCNRFAGGRPDLKMTKPRVVTLIDYTKDSNKPRLFVFDLEQKRLNMMYVSHGRYGNTSRSNSQLSSRPPQNSVSHASYFSNEAGKNASAGGFFLTGTDYWGEHGRSLVLHGLEKGVNDNACERATVIHKSSYVTSRGVKRMSSGCPMVSEANLDPLIDTLKGDSSGGSFLYVFTPDEAAKPNSFCGRELRLAPNSRDDSGLYRLTSDFGKAIHRPSRSSVTAR